MAKFCTKCGSALDASGQCPSCTAAPVARFCMLCGSRLDEQGKCSNCSVAPPVVAPPSGSTTDTTTFTKKVTRSLSRMAGVDEAVDLKIKDLFSEVFVKHSPEEAEEIFTSGTAKTTPLENEISTTWPKPWLYSRVFLMLLVSFVFLYICYDSFENINALPGMIFMGAITVPFSLIVFFAEVNAPRNISFFEILKIFFVGGAASLAVTLLLFEIAPEAQGNGFAIIIGIVEEMGKWIIVAYYLWRMPKAKYVLNGMLIGAAVGAGFAVFETAGYILRSGLALGTDEMMHTLFLRAYLAPGGHVIWAAIEGGALMLAKGDQPFQTSQLKDKRFISFTALCVALHAIWDMDIGLFEDISLPVVQLCLTVIGWVIALVLINVGLKEVSNRKTPAVVPMTEENSEVIPIDALEAEAEASIVQ